MSQEDVLLDLVGRTYRAALEPDEWPSLLAAIADATGSVGAGLHWIGKPAFEQIFSANARLGDDGMHEYEAHYAKVCPRMREAFARRSGSVIVDYDLLSEAQMDRHELYADFLAPRGLRYFAGVVALNDDSQHCAFAINRSAGQGHFDGEDLELVRCLAPHIARAVEMQQRFGAFAAERRSLAAALDRLQLAVILVDARARPVLMNRAAELIVARNDGLASVRHGLVAATSTATAALRRAIAEAARTGASDGLTAARALALPRPSGARAYELLVASLPPNETRIGIAGAVAAVFVGDSEKCPKPPLEVLRSLYGLTPAEAELAAALAGGRSLAAFAEATGRQVKTVRKTLKHVFAKTETTRQAELVARLLKGPAGLDGTDPDDG